MIEHVKKGTKTTYYWLTVAISADELADYMGCLIEEIENGDYIGAIREAGEIVKLEEVEE
jgi:hypothetical protein